MGWMNAIQSMAGAGGGNETTRVAGGLMSALEQHPGGLGAVLDSFRNNGMGGHVDAMQDGQAPPMSPDQVQTGLQGTGLLQTVAERAGVSPEVAKVGMAVVLPMVMAHFAKNGETPNQGALGGMLSKIL